MLNNQSFIDFAAEALKAYPGKVDPTKTYWAGANWEQTMEFRRTNPLKNPTSREEIDKVLHWGGIYRFQQHGNVPGAIDWVNRKNGKIPTYVNNTISSYTKLFSFHKPDQYFILDAKVAFSLNAIAVAFGREKREFNLIPFSFRYRTRNPYILSNFCVFDVYREHRFPTIPYLDYNECILGIHSYWRDKDILKDLGWEGFQRPEIVEMIMFNYFIEIFELHMPQQTGGKTPV